MYQIESTNSHSDSALEMDFVAVFGPSAVAQDVFALAVRVEARSDFNASSDEADEGFVLDKSEHRP